MKAELLYNGSLVTWVGKRVYRATSGMPGHQVPTDQCLPDRGPVPEGLYKLFIQDLGTAVDKGKNQCALKPAWGIQKIPRGAAAGACDPYWANWGYNRVRMEPADKATRQRCAPLKRSGFYMHDSVKGFSHGCIEVDKKKVESKMRKFLKTHTIKNIQN